MKKNYLILLIAFAGFMPECIMAQNSKEADDLQLARAKENAAVEAKVTAALMRKKYQTDAMTEQSLYTMYYEQKLAVALTFAKFSKSPNLELKLAAVMAKNDSVNEVYLRAAKTKSLYKNKVLRPADNSRFAQAIRLRSQLNLDSLQISKLYFQTNKAHELDGDLTFRLREFERSQLPSILRDDQYTKLLKQANHKQALGWAQGDWKELKERGISTGLDSSKVVNEIYNYDIAKLVLQDKYGDSKPLSTNLKELESPIPESLKRLKTARRYNNPVADKSSNTTYSW